MSNEIKFDEKQGISVEEQKEILSQINGIAQKNKESLSSQDYIDGVVKEHKKKGFVFPLAINIAAIAALVAGAVLLIVFNSRIETEVRTGNAIFNLTERALIDEIRRETADAVARKEMEIASIISRLDEVDRELSLLYSDNLELTSEQRAAQQRLLATQNAYRDELSSLQNERAQILENSRSREARLRAQLDERTREFAAVQQRITGELEEALRELERLTNERDRLIALETLISNVSAGGEAVFVPEESPTVDVRQYEETIAELQRTVNTLSSGGSEQVRRLRELEETITTLRASNAALTQSASEKDALISSLETETAASAQTITQLRAQNTAQEQEIANLRNQLTIIRQALQEN